jgi:hypothetical protein
MGNQFNFDEDHEITNYLARRYTHSSTPMRKSMRFIGRCKNFSPFSIKVPREGAEPISTDGIRQQSVGPLDSPSSPQVVRQ